MAVITRLRVVNAALRALGEAPVTSADSSHPSALIASSVLDEMLEDVLSGNWWFNREQQITLTPNGSGEIVLPDNTLSVDPVDVTSPYVQRGNRLYDPQNSTFNIGRPVRVKYRPLLDLEALPYAAANLVRSLTVHRVFLDEDGDLQKLARYEQQVLRHTVMLQQEHLRNSDTNSNNAPIARKIKQRFVRRGGYRGT